MRPPRVFFSIYLRGVPIGFHWSVGLMLIWALYAINSPINGLMFFAGSILIIVIHEMGHATLCRWTHYSVHRIVVHFLGGYCEHEAPGYRRDQLLIAVGGVLFQIALAGVALIVLSAVGMEHLSGPSSFLLLTVLVYYNIFLIALNLIPFPGLDGSYLLEALQMTMLPRHPRSLRRSQTSRGVTSRTRSGSQGAKMHANPTKSEDAQRIAKDLISKMPGGTSDDASPRS